ncbi:hypothetical protein Tco_0986976 [Tanacetum coccineum]
MYDEENVDVFVEQASKKIEVSIRVFLPRIPLASSEEDMFPFKPKRKQFLVRLSFAMPINKAQAHTISNVGVYLLLALSDLCCVV